MSHSRPLQVYIARPANPDPLGRDPELHPQPGVIPPTTLPLLLTGRGGGNGFGGGLAGSLPPLPPTNATLKSNPNTLLLGLSPEEYEELRLEAEREARAARGENVEANVMETVEVDLEGGVSHLKANTTFSPRTDSEPETRPPIWAAQKKPQRERLKGEAADRKYHELRQEKALLSWQRQSEEWRRVEMRVAEAVGRTPSGLLSHRSPPVHRRRTETSRALDLALRERSRAAGCDFWHTGYRVGYDRWGLVMGLPKGGMREIERVISPDEGDEKDSSHDTGRIFTPFEEFRERRMKEVAEEMAQVDPFWENPDPGFLEVVGKSPPVSNTTQGALSSTPEVSPVSTAPGSAESRHLQSSAIVPVSLPPPPYVGPRLLVPIRRLSFEAASCEVAVGCVTVYNVGTTSVWFEWTEVKRGTRQQKPGSAKVSKVDAASNRERLDQLPSHATHPRRFFFSRRRAAVLPGRAFDIPIAFRSDAPGRFKEEWKIETDPECAIGGWKGGEDDSAPAKPERDNDAEKEEENEGVVMMVGTALHVDVTAKKREAIKAMLRRKRATTAARFVIDRILDDLPTGGPGAATSSPAIRMGKQAVDAGEREFLFRNADMHLHYNPAVVGQLEELALEVARAAHGGVIPAGWRWNRSVDVLNDLTDRVTDASLRSAFLRRLNDHVHRLLLPPAGSADRVAPQLARDIVAALCDDVAAVSWKLREDRGLDVKRKCLIKFMPGSGDVSVKGNKCLSVNSMSF
ncbi:hypothetical protein M427DRAFT_212009 [Gonapodya prolifera JEL478]|uniref:MYCBP-associated protein n=1 Tax=Gonapodya prolifera (strain JEL478) TaxID=1344416 RepID=A0A139AP19_GONPJ|nr:hypothetical protein M427DRAFT_212009 [Gonapodya prolifera JEL478]|eukprot:KXS18507.1 hypothetical protein M427DRAFT_212009 [Gonapodya prolifera JEL478]